jgi:hypothetical protein
MFYLLNYNEDEMPKNEFFPSKPSEMHGSRLKKSLHYYRVRDVRYCLTTQTGTASSILEARLQLHFTSFNDGAENR